MSNSSIHYEHWSFFHNFKQASWMVNSDLLLRIPIMLIFFLWFATSIPFIHKIPGIDFLARLINFITIPLHTLLICKSKMDRTYLIHLSGFPLYLAFYAIQSCVRATNSKNERLQHINAAIGYTMFSICFLPEVSKWSWTPPVWPGGVHLSKAFPYKVTSHRKIIDQTFKKANSRYNMLFFLSKLPLIVTFLKFDSFSIDQFSNAIIFKDVSIILVTLWG